MMAARMGVTSRRSAAGGGRRINSRINLAKKYRSSDIIVGRVGVPDPGPHISAIMANQINDVLAGFRKGDKSKLDMV